MADHPFMQTAYTLSNIVVIIASLVLGLAILPRLRVRLNWTIVAAMVFFVLNAGQHLLVTFGILFCDMATIGQNWWLLALRIGTAVSLSAFVAGIFIDIGRWKTLQDSMNHRPQPPT